MSEPTPRQVLYGLVAGGFVLVVAVLTVGAASAGLVPSWWSLTMSVLLISIGIWTGLRWRRTAVVLALAIGVFVVWTVGTLLLMP